jgi:hypothetical protein
MKKRNAFLVSLLAILLGVVFVETLTATKTVVLTEPMFRPGWEETGNFVSLD